MGKKGKKAQTGKPKKLTPKEIGKRLDALVKNLEEELKGAELFAPLPPTEDCAICCLPLSRIPVNTCYKACCGKEMCMACSEGNEAIIKKQNEKNAGKNKPLVLPEACPFCRAIDSLESLPDQLEKRAAKGDRSAHEHLAEMLTGASGVAVPWAKNEAKGLSHQIQAIELGSGIACGSMAMLYRDGRGGVSANKQRSLLFDRVAALRGCLMGRHSIGVTEYFDFGNHELGIRHWKIAAEGGSQHSLDILKDIYNAGGKFPGKEFVSKEELDRIYRVGHDTQQKMKSEGREKYEDSIVKTMGKGRAKDLRG